jgi:glutathione peroxidase
MPGLAFYDFTAETNEGGEISFAQYKGKVLLIVNTASKCGFTPQYDGLEALYKKYGPEGLVVVGFPCDQFGHQEPGSDEEIEAFCRLNYGVTFPLMAKSDVNGENASIKWNFTKFLIDRKGRVVARFEPVVTPEELESEIEALL